LNNHYRPELPLNVMGEQDSEGEELRKARVDPKNQPGAGEGRSAYVFAADGASTMHFGLVETLNGSNARGIATGGGQTYRLKQEDR
jgi:hypothetical protein